jgi:ABC-2 type transport system permease protein
MNIINQIFYTAKRIIVDIKPVLTRLITFIVIILILGSAFSEAFNVSDLDTVKIVYYSDDSGKYGEGFIRALTDVESVKSLVKFEEVFSFEEAKLLVNNDDAEAFIYIPKIFSEQSIEEDKSKVVEVYRKKYSGVSALIVQNVVDSYINGINTAGVIFRMTGTLDGFELSTDRSLQTEPLTKSESPTAMGYYAVGMLLMLLLSGAEYGRVYIGEDYLGILGDRMKLSPIKPFEQYLGKIIGLSFVSFLQGLAIILFTQYAYQVDWGNNFSLILLIVFVFSLLTTTFGAMLSIVTKDVTKAGSIVSVAIIVFTFLAGGFVVMDFGNIQKLSPSYYAKTAIFNAVYNGDIKVTYQSIVIMCAITLALAFISIAAVRRKKA